jgi:hypothetical protein
MLIVGQVALWLLLLELVLRAVAPHLPPRLAMGANYVLTGERYQVRVTDTMQSDGDHNIALKPNLQQVTYRVSPTVSFTFSTIALWGSTIGFRTRPIDYQVEVVAVGDSFTFCFTALADCWVTQFEQLSGLGTVNLGIPGTGSLSHWHALEKFGAPLKPRLVLWQFYGNDFNEDYGLAINKGEIADLVGQGEFVIPPAPPSQPLFEGLRRHSVLFAVTEIALFNNDYAYMTELQRMFTFTNEVQWAQGRMLIGQPYENQIMDTTNPRNAAGIPYTRRALQAAQTLVQSWGGELVVIVLPTRENVYAHLTAPIVGEAALATQDQPRQVVLGLCQELQLRCLDVLPILQTQAQAGAALYYVDDVHLSPTGNTALAVLVRDWLGGEGILYAAP